MKNILFSCICALGLSFSGSAQVKWMDDFKTAQKLSVVSNKLMIVEFWATWCMPCKKMDQEVWSSEAVGKLSENFVPVKIDADNNMQLMGKFGVDRIPYFFITDSQGNILYNKYGFTSEHEIKNLLERYSINLSYMQGALVQYYQQRNYITTMRLANKYLDYSLFVNKIIRGDILKLSDHYLNEAEQLLDRNQDNYVFMVQKVELLKAVIDLYDEKFDKVERYLDKKIEAYELKAQNRVLYAYLNYCVSCGKGEPLEMDKWRKELKKYSTGDLYLSRAEKLLE